MFNQANLYRNNICMLFDYEVSEADELELAQMMVKDLEKLWKSYAKKALEAKREQERRTEKQGFLEYETAAELTDAFGYDVISEEVYRRGLDYFENAEQPVLPSVVELHRLNIKKLLDKWKANVRTLDDIVNPVEKRPQLNIFEQMDIAERLERQKAMQLADSVEAILKNG